MLLIPPKKNCTDEKGNVAKNSSQNAWKRKTDEHIRICSPKVIIQTATKSKRGTRFTAIFFFLDKFS